jgi:signal transduction histidine kinase/CheY-like chemotaxis protein
MTAKQHIFRVRRNYNQWVANQTLEDYALRFTAKSARRWSSARVATTALGAISFLALEAIGGAITLHYGFNNAVAAIMAVGLIIFLTAIPISYYAAKYGVDIDLLTRGAGFGYIGSTITSLIYASFTFIFFALEAAIMAMALELLFDIPLAYGYLISALVVIPLVTHGITFISRFQLWTQAPWLVLQLLPFIYIIYADASSIENWTAFTGTEQSPAQAQGEGINILLFGAASAVIFSLIAQIGEQVDFLRFLPPPKQNQRGRWWLALMAGGPGWIIVGVIKILAGSFLAVLALGHGVPASEAADPTRMYMVAFSYVTHSPEVALAVAGIFVIICQLKINVTNAYAGSIAWSNFFSRLTHSHPGRVVWLVFNVTIALLLMELGVYRALEQTLGVYGIVAVAWLGAMVADLVINKPLGLSPKYIEFKRAHLYDINPVGVGSMLLASLIGISCHAGFFGDIPQALSHFIALLAALVIAPLIAWGTKGRYYIARPTIAIGSPQGLVSCCICEHRFEQEDVTHCPAYAGNICSLCCSLDARCNDYCKPGGGYAEQLRSFFTAFLPAAVIPNINSRLAHFLSLVFIINGLSAILLSMIYFQTITQEGATAPLLAATLWKVFFLLVIITGVVSWLFVLAHESRVVAQEETQRQTKLLMEEIVAHEKTDQALQEAKEHAEAANQAKSRYLTGISHELRSPLNAVLGYAQLLEKDPAIPANRKDALTVIRRSGEHLADLIEGLLDISKIEAGRLDLHQDQVRIAVLMDQLVQMFRLQAEAKGLEFEYHCEDRLPEFVRTDEKRLRQILINVLSNAVKYTERGKVSLTLRYRSQVAEFTITDTGEGIAPDNIERIFRPFERVRTPGSTATGTGLGLTISRLLADIMGGDIAVSSTPGKGSTFKVSLMLASLARPLDFPTAPVQNIYGYRGTVRTIMIVDDEVSHRQLMRAMLMPIGFDIVEVDNPTKALAMLTAQTELDNRPDLVLLDVSMPGINGWQLAAQLRTAHYRSPIIMVSADASEGRNQDFMLSPEAPPLHDAYVIKPVRLSVLLDHIGRLLKLNWCYDQEANLIPGCSANKTIDQVVGYAGGQTPELTPHQPAMINTLQFPEEIHLAGLRQLALIGHKNGLLQRLQYLEETGAANRDFIEHIRLLTVKFHFEKIINMLTPAALTQESTETTP